jgi:hypothetical protein
MPYAKQEGFNLMLAIGHLKFLCVQPVLLGKAVNLIENLLVQYSLDLGRIDVGLVVPHEASVDDLGQ